MCSWIMHFQYHAIHDETGNGKINKNNDIIMIIITLVITIIVVVITILLFVDHDEEGQAPTILKPSPSSSPGMLKLRSMAINMLKRQCE